MGGWFKTIRLSDDVWRWLVLLSGTLLLCFKFGSFFSYGVIIPHLHSTYHTSMTELTIISTLPLALSNIFSIVPVILKRKIPQHENLVISFSSTILLAIGYFLSSIVYNPSWLLLTYSVISGISLCFLSIGSMSAVGEYFPRGADYFIFATTLVISSIPLAMIIFNPLMYLILDLYGWRSTLISYGAIVCILGVPASLTFVSKADGMSREVEKDDESCEVTIHSPKLYQSMQDTSIVNYNSVSTEVVRLEINPDIQKKDLEKKFKKYQDSSTQTETITDTDTNKQTDTQANIDLKENTHLDTETKTKISTERGRHAENEKGVWRIMLDSEFKTEIALISLGIGTTFIVQIGYLTILPHYLVLISVSDNGEILMFFGVGHLVPVLVGALIGPYLKGWLVWVNMIGNLLTMVLLITVNYVKNYTYILILNAFLGVAFGFPVTYLITSTVEVTCLPIDVTWALVSTSMGVACVIVPGITGAIYDIRNSYHDSFIAMAVVIFLSSLAYAVIIIIGVWKKTKLEKEINSRLQ